MLFRSQKSQISLRICRSCWRFKMLELLFTRQNTLQNGVLGILSVARFKTKSPAAQYSKDISILRDYIYLEQMPILSNLRHYHRQRSFSRLLSTGQSVYTINFMTWHKFHATELSDISHLKPKCVCSFLHSKYEVNEFNQVVFTLKYGVPSQLL